MQQTRRRLLVLRSVVLPLELVWWLAGCSDGSGHPDDAVGYDGETLTDVVDDEARIDTGTDGDGWLDSDDAVDGDTHADDALPTDDGGAEDVGPDEEEDGSDLDASSCPDSMVYVPAGPFVMGSDPDEAVAESGELPEHVVVLSAYCIDRTEVTNSDWRACVASGACLVPESPDSWSMRDYYYLWDRYPAINVTWEAARGYCEWRGNRLPTEAEWEKAARGGCEIVSPVTCGPEDERSFPWGDEEPDCDRANFRPESGPDCEGDTSEVASTPAGNSPYGVSDLAGNVHEWVADWLDVEYYASCLDDCVDPRGPAVGAERVHRGGDFATFGHNIEVTVRWAAVPWGWMQSLGFRCAKPAD